MDCASTEKVVRKPLYRTIGGVNRGKKSGTRYHSV